MRVVAALDDRVRNVVLRRKLQLKAAVLGNLRHIDQELSSAIDRRLLQYGDIFALPFGIAAFNEDRVGDLRALGNKPNVAEVSARVFPDCVIDDEVLLRCGRCLDVSLILEIRRIHREEQQRNCCEDGLHAEFPEAFVFATPVDSLSQSRWYTYDKPMRTMPSTMKLTMR